MSAAPLPPNETERLQALYRYGVLDTATEDSFDGLTRLAGRLFDVPIALISLIDTNRQWFKSRYGLEARQTHRDYAFCAHAILDQEAILEVLDPLGDSRFADNPLVTGEPHIRYYAGTPLVTADGLALGTFCLLDRRPRSPLDEGGRDGLRTLAAAALTALELRLERLDRTLTARATMELEILAGERLGHLAHELKTPITAVLGYSQLAKAQVSTETDGDRLEGYADRIQRAGEHMLDLVESLLEPLRRRQDKDTGPALDSLDLPGLLRDVAGLTQPLVDRQGMRLEVAPAANLPAPRADALRLRQILVNFITNAVKYAATGTIHVTAAPTEDGRLCIAVRDEGPGIAPDDQTRLFEEGFRTADVGDREGFGSGLALSRLAARTMRGDVGVDSAPGTGATFWVMLPVA